MFDPLDEGTKKKQKKKLENMTLDDSLLKVGSCSNDDDFVQIIFCLFV